MFIKNKRLDSNHGPLVFEATTLPTEPQPLPLSCHCCRFSQKKCFKSRKMYPRKKVFFRCFAFAEVWGKVFKCNDDDDNWWENFLGKNSQVFVPDETISRQHINTFVTLGWEPWAYSIKICSQKLMAPKKMAIWLKIMKKNGSMNRPLASWFGACEWRLEVYMAWVWILQPDAWWLTFQFFCRLVVSTVGKGQNSI